MSIVAAMAGGDDQSAAGASYDDSSAVAQPAAAAKVASESLNEREGLGKTQAGEHVRLAGVSHSAGEGGFAVEWRRSAFRPRTPSAVLNSRADARMEP